MREEIRNFAVADKPRLFTRRFTLATVGNLVFFIGVTSFFSFPVHLAELGGSRAEIGRIMGSFGLSALFAIPLTGSLTDRYGRRRFMLIGSVGWAALSLAFVFADEIGPAMYLLRIGQGAVFSLAFVATNALIVDLAPPGGLARAISLFGATTLVAHAVGPSLGEWVAERFGFVRLFELSAALALVAALIHTRSRDEPRARVDRAETDLGMIALSTRRGAVGPLVAALGTAVTFGAAINFMPVFVRARGLASHAPFFVSYVAAAILVRLAAGGASDRFGHRPVAAVAALGFAASAAGFGFMHRSVPELVVLALLFGVSHGLAYPAMNALFVEDAPASARGRAMALFNLSFNVGITLSAFAAGELAERSGYSAMWWAAAAVSVLGVGVLVVDRPRVSGPAGRAG